MTSSNGNIFRVTGPLCGEFTGHKGQWHRALMFSLICAWINVRWVNNREAGDLRRHRAHYDATVMFWRNHGLGRTHVLVCVIDSNPFTFANLSSRYDHQIASRYDNLRIYWFWKLIDRFIHMSRWLYDYSHCQIDPDALETRQRLNLFLWSDSFGPVPILVMLWGQGTHFTNSFWGYNPIIEKIFYL